MVRYAYQCGDRAHRTVWKKAHGPIPPGHVVHHKNGDGLDNRLENLELIPDGVHKSHHFKGRVSPMKGRVQTASARERIGAAKKGRAQTSEQIATRLASPRLQAYYRRGEANACLRIHV